MKERDSTISEDVSEQPASSTHDENTARVNSKTNHRGLDQSNSIKKASSERFNVNSSGNIRTNTANFAARNVNAKTDMNSEEYVRSFKYFNMQNNAYMKASYSDDARTAGYYGWIPGMNSMRLPAMIYPPSFIGFAPTVAWMKTNGNILEQATNIEKVDRWKEDLSRNKTECPSEVSQVDSSASADVANSDDDEGLVLEEREIKRRRNKDSEKLHIQARKALPERSSVIQENMFIQSKPTVTIAHDARQDEQDEQERQSKRGRASTRKIDKTEQYWDRRKKNNVSAKKSRDARRQRETLTTQRSSVLETENLRLRAELATVRDENTRLKQELNELKKN